jgi:hypothetical protein
MPVWRASSADCVPRGDPYLAARRFITEIESSCTERVAGAG